MTNRIFKSIMIVAMFVFIASLVTIMGVLHSYFSLSQKTQLKDQAESVAAGVNTAGASFLKELDPEDYRITHISATGEVLYDSGSNKKDMENHLEREEVKEAIENGTGESTRYSTTMMEKQLYESIRLKNGGVIRVSAKQQTIFGLLLAMLQSIIIVIGITLALAFILAYNLTKRVIKPLNDMDISGATDTEYEELQPLIDRIRIQKNEINIERDRTNRKQLEFETVTKNMDEGLLLLNKEDKIMFANPSAAKILRLEHHIKDETPISETNCPIEILRMIEKTRNGHQMDQSITLKGKSYDVHSDPVITDGTIQGTAMLLVDMSWQDKAENIRREFTANVTHELKTPLQTISGSAELMYDGLVKDEDIREFAGNIYKESKRLISLIDDITGLSQLDEGQYDKKIEDIDLYEEAETTISELKTAADTQGVSLKLTGSPVTIKGIRRLVHSIIFNLTDNAIKYSKLSGNVCITVSEYDNKARLTVSDDGIGIPVDEQERVFERFYRVDKSRSKEVGGTGLGLSIVKHAAKVHDAKIELSSAPDKGTTITCEFYKDFTHKR